MEDYQEIFNRFKIPIALSIVGLVLIAGGMLSSKKPEPQNFPKESLISQNEPELVSVDISGQVQNPGVYQLTSTSRVEEVIAAAGGFTQSANSEYISKYLNLAQRVSDGTKIYIPAIGEDYLPLSNPGSIAGASQTLVSLNSSTQAELENLPGIGPVTASKIISERPFSKIEELLEKKIVNKSTYEKIKELILIN